MSDTVNKTLIACYLYFLEKYIGTKLALTTLQFLPDDYQWIKPILFDSTNARFYPTTFYPTITDTTHAAYMTEINNTGSLTFKKWSGQKTLIIGCGHVNTKAGPSILPADSHQPHTHVHRPSREYLIDTDITILPDMCINVCHTPLHIALPSPSHNQIKTIIFEGLCAEETSIFTQDCLTLLREDGIVLANNPLKPTITKKNNILYAIQDDDTLIPYTPWTQTDIDNNTFGHDVFGWKEQFIRNGQRMNDLRKNMLSPTEALVRIQRSI